MIYSQIWPILLIDKNHFGNTNCSSWYWSTTLYMNFKQNHEKCWEWVFFFLSTKFVIFSLGKKLGELFFFGSNVDDINLAIFVEMFFWAKFSISKNGKTRKKNLIWTMVK